ncbi:MAG: imelysin family protein [Pseudomonadota bacterium]
MRILTTIAFLSYTATAGAISVFSDDEATLLQQGLRTTADEFIVPSYAAYADASSSLQTSLKAYCNDGGTIGAVHEDFAAMFLAWQRASIVQIGPVADAEGPLRIQMWPDPKGFSRRAVMSAVKNADDALLEKDGLSGRSIALINLTALELLLYGDLVPASYECDLSLAITSFQADLAEEMVDQWSVGGTYRTAYDTAFTGNDIYPDIDSLLRDVLAGGVVYVDRIRKFKLLRGLGSSPGMARPERTEAQRSSLGLKSIEVSFRALRDFYETPLGLFDVAPDMDGSIEYFVLGETAGSIADSLASIDAPMAEIAREDGERAKELRRFAELILYHESFFKTGFSRSIGLSAGFTSADGD